MNNKEEEQHGSFIVDSVLKSLGINKDQIEKVKKMIDMMEIDDNEIRVDIGDNINIRIKKH
jgi:hypothetical protein